MTNTGLINYVTASRLLIRHGARQAFAATDEIHIECRVVRHLGNGPIPAANNTSGLTFLNKVSCEFCCVARTLCLVEFILNLLCSK